MPKQPFEALPLLFHCSIAATIPTWTLDHQRPTTRPLLTADC
jgi:hypothetical protein